MSRWRPNISAVGRQLAAAQGTRDGFPDYILPIQAKGFSGLAFELKAPKPWGRAPTPKQREWLDMFACAGWFTGTAFGAEEAAAMCVGYMAGIAQPVDPWFGNLDR